MDPVVLNSTINNLFPDINSDLKEKIYQSVSGHMIEFLKEKVYQEDPVALRALNETSSGGHDVEGRSKMYGQQIIKKLLSLPKEKREIISKELDEELINVLNKVYKAYA